MLHRPEERRRYGRIHLTPPLQGEADAIRVNVDEVSIIGACVSHEGRLPRARSHRLRFTWNGRTLEYQCEAVRSTVVRLARRAGETTLYETGLRLTEPVGEAQAALRELISEHVVSAINEQIANARGVPPLEVTSYRSGKSNRFRRCEWISGAWRRSETRSPDQPDEGFTIAADVDPYHVELLCRTWELCDEVGRLMTKLFAELSISKQEGAIERHYLP